MKTFIKRGLLATLLAAGVAAADVVVIVNAQNPTTAGADDIKRILLGRETHFPGNGPVSPILRSDRWEKWGACTERFMEKTPDAVERSWATRVFSGSVPAPRVVATDSEAVQAVAANPDGITCVEEASLAGNTRVKIIGR